MAKRLVGQEINVYANEQAADAGVAPANQLFSTIAA
jgi:hypothetical protein